MVIPHLRVNYLTRNKWLGNNLEARGIHAGRPARGLLNLVYFVTTGHNSALSKSCYRMDLCRFENILEVLFGTTYQSRMIYWLHVCLGEKLMSVLMGKWMLFHPGALVMTARYFIFSVGDLVKEQLDYIKAFSDQKPASDVVLLICTSKTKHILLL